MTNMASMGSVRTSSDEQYRDVTVTEHPSLTPLFSFHGRLVHCLSSPLPLFGRIQEIAKRTFLIIAAVFAYPVLGLIAVEGYPFTIQTSKRVRVSGNHIDERASEALRVTQQAGRESMESVAPFLRKNNITKMKYILTCDVGEKKAFELDILPRQGCLTSSDFNDSVGSMLQQMKNWIDDHPERSSGQIRISGLAFCLSPDELGVSSWSASSSSTEEKFEASEMSHSVSIPLDRSVEYLHRRGEGLGIPGLKNISSAAELFHTKLT